MKKLYTVISVLAILLLIVGVVKWRSDSTSHDYNPFGQHESKNSIYWWKTTFDPDSAEWAFIAEHHIERMYVRYFDVVYDPANRPESIVPNATLEFKQEFPDSLEIIPTIFITNEAMASWPKERSSDYNWYYTPQFKTSNYYIEQLIYRIKAMNQRNHVRNVKEIQVDCDWSESTRETFFAFCDSLRTRLHDEGIALSSTIRLHQLRQAAPPVDRGVLMCYNTGALRTLSTQNSILHSKDVYSHLRFANLRKFGIPMDVAYPTFGWSVMYSPDSKFLGLVRTTDLSDTETFRLRSDGLCEILRECTAGHALLQPGNLLRLEMSEMSTLREVKAQIDLRRDTSEVGYSTILYHLDSRNLSNYSPDEIEYLYH